MPFHKIVETFVLEKKHEVASNVNFASCISNLIAQVLEFTIEEVNADQNVPDMLNNMKNGQVVLNLHEKRILTFKDVLSR